MDIHNAHPLSVTQIIDITIPSPPFPDWHSVAIAWLVEVGQRTGSKRTPVEYGRYFGRFLLFHSDPSRATPGDVHAFAYGTGPTGKQPGPAAVIVRLAALRGFYYFGRRMGMFSINPALDVKTPKMNESIPKGLSAEQVRLLLSAIPDTVSGSRDKAIVLTAVLTGLRRSEVLGLTKGNIDVYPASGRATYKVRAKADRNATAVCQPRRSLRSRHRSSGEATNGMASLRIPASSISAMSGSTATSSAMPNELGFVG